MKADSTVNWIDKFILRFGDVVGWLFPLLVIAICSQVVLRKMGNNLAWLDDMQWWIYGFATTVGFVYAITTQSHVRVDILFLHFNKGKKARTEILGLGWMLGPFLVLMMDILAHYAIASFSVREGSDSPNGLHMLYLLKMILPVIFGLALLATVSMVIRHLRVLCNVRLWSVLVALFPTAWFLLERFSHYLLWWFVRFTQPDIKPRSIAKEPLLEPTMWYGLGILLFLIVLSLLRSGRAVNEVQD